MLIPVGNRAKEIVLKNLTKYNSNPDKEAYLCFLPELTGQEENFLINSANNFLVMIYPMGEEYSEKVALSSEIAKRIERRRSKMILYDDEMKKFPNYAFSKLLEIREHLIFLFYSAYVQMNSLFLGRDGIGMSYSKIKYDPFSTADTVRQSPWYLPGKEEVFSFSKYNAGHIVSPDLGEIFIATFKE